METLAPALVEYPDGTFSVATATDALPTPVVNSGFVMPRAPTSTTANDFPLIVQVAPAAGGGGGGGGAAPTVTVTLAAGLGPVALVAITLKVEVALTVRLCPEGEAPEVPAATPVPVQAYVVFASVLVQVALSATVPVAVIVSGFTPLAVRVQAGTAGAPGTAGTQVSVGASSVPPASHRTQTFAGSRICTGMTKGGAACTGSEASWKITSPTLANADEYLCIAVILISGDIRANNSLIQLHYSASRGAPPNSLAPARPTHGTAHAIPKDSTPGAKKTGGDRSPPVSLH
jgi:hypothetical protein